MDMITTTDALAAFCGRAKGAPYVTIDTEFLRERSYYSKLCLVQVALPGKDGEAVLIDPLADGIKLDPLYELLADKATVKVFHAARQDVEIFFVEGGLIPEPLFDTQVAAMVCGFGEQVGYETLVRKIAKQPLDKTSRFTDWSRRPLSDAQLAYALADVTHLRVIYEELSRQLEESGRTPWLEEEMRILKAPQTYRVQPEDAWRRIKTRTNSGKFLAMVQALAEFRERYAQERNIPRNRVFKDEALLELASTKPKSMKDLSRARLLMRDARRGEIAEGILAAVERVNAMSPSDYPKVEAGSARQQVNPALSDLLRVLLKAKAEQAGVAQKLIATSAELDSIAAGERDSLALKGWRREVFGADALRLVEGEVGLAVNGEKIDVIEL